jgi:hypothetical protein
MVVFLDDGRLALIAPITPVELCVDGVDDKEGELGGVHHPDQPAGMVVVVVDVDGAAHRPADTPSRPVSHRRPDEPTVFSALTS